MKRPPKINPVWMDRALQLAEHGRGEVEPNPMVGCVIVKGSRVVGEGYHRRFGGPHAEVDALRRAGRAAHGATVYVTLEPCCHHGKTPPCTDALISAGVARVVIACRDPFPAVAGKGIARLRRAGIEVRTGVMRARALAINAPFFKRVTQGLPYVIAKWAMTLDGAIATERGRSRWISNTASRRLVHELRGRVDAVIVGIGTALADDPRLTARGVKVHRVARRVVIDPALRIPPESRLVCGARRAPLTVVASAATMEADASRVGALARSGVEVFGVRPRRDGSLPVRAILRHLARRHEAANVLVEGGGRTLGRFFEGGFVDEAWVFIAPRILGDPGAVRPVAMMPKPKGFSIPRSPRFTLAEGCDLDGDLFLRYRAEV